MKNIVILIVFLLGVAALIYWLWSDNQEEQTFQQVIEEYKDDPAKVPVRPVPSVDEVEIAIDENGLLLKKLYNEELNIRVTDKEVKDVEVFDGILTYSEYSDQTWSFKAVNLLEYIDQYLKPLEG